MQRHSRTKLAVASLAGLLVGTAAYAEEEVVRFGSAGSFGNAPPGQYVAIIEPAANPTGLIMRTCAHLASGGWGASYIQVGTTAPGSNVLRLVQTTQSGLSAFSNCQNSVLIPAGLGIWLLSGTSVTSTFWMSYDPLP